ncbi:hypothetical protein Tco_0915772 [Tanacetum coccineum]
MTGPTPDPVTPINQVTRNNDNPNNSPSLQDQILDHVSSLKALIKQHNERSGTLIEPIRLTLSEKDGGDKGKGIDKGAEEEDDEDLQKPYKEILKSIQPRRMVDASVVQVPKTVTEMMKRVDDFIKSEEVYRSTGLPRGELPKRG